MAIARPRVSKIESATEDMRISTTDRYFTALGGHLKITAAFDDGNELPIRNQAA